MTSSTDPIHIIHELGQRLLTGNTEDLLASRSRLETLDLVKLSQCTTRTELTVLYIARNFIFDVLANLTGSATFSYPTKDGQLGRSISEVIHKTGMFLNSVSTNDLAGALADLQDALDLYYGVLFLIDEASATSDLSYVDV